MLGGMGCLSSQVKLVLSTQPGMLGGMGCLDLGLRHLGLDWPHHPQEARQELVWQLAGEIYKSGTNPRLAFRIKTHFQDSQIRPIPVY